MKAKQSPVGGAARPQEAGRRIPFAGPDGHSGSLVLADHQYRRRR